MNEMTLYWIEQSESDTPSSDNWLTASELSQLGGMRVPKRQADWRLGRWTAKLAVAAWINRSSGGSELFRRIELRVQPSGAPEVFLDGDRLAATISLSHSSGVAMCALAPGEAALGCDLELIEPRSGAFVSDYFTAEEQGQVTCASPPDRSLLATLIWSSKESALKALGEGLRLDTRSVTVSFVGQPFASFEQNEDWRALVVAAGAGCVFRGWWRTDRTFVRTVVAEPAPHRLAHIRVPATLKASGAIR